MPVILEQQDWPTWLGEVEGDPATLLRPAGEDVLKVWPVSKQVNSPRNNGAELLEPVGSVPPMAASHCRLRLAGD
jgi:putative SOS response-associated peptidase YedK